jgi:alkylation response protein AidB-like acyl-CoA dehydrogenase
VAVEVVDEALQLHGGYGYFNDYDIERNYRAAKVLKSTRGPGGGKIVIAREILENSGLTELQAVIRGFETASTAV